MSQNDMVIPDQSGVNFLNDLNLALAALASDSIGTTRPPTTYQGQLWVKSNYATNTWAVYRVTDPANAALDALEYFVNTTTGKVIYPATGGVRTITTADSPYTLTLADAGLVLVDASAGNVAITTPSAADLPALEYVFARIDGSANTATVSADGAEAIGGAASISLAVDDIRKAKGDGVNEFHLEADNALATTTKRGTAVLATIAKAQSGAGSEVATCDDLGNTVLGINQTPQDMSGSRAFGVTHTNATGRTIYVSVSMNESSGTTAYATGLIDGVAKYEMRTRSASTGHGQIMGFPVPPGSTYRINVTSSPTIKYWTELR